MTVVAPERAMARMRDILAKASISGARKWTFVPPTTGEDSTRDSWTVRVPVTFALNDNGNAQPERYGRWRAFIPGPRQAAPWRKPDAAGQAGSDLLPAGGVYMVDGTQRGLRLLTPRSLPGRLDALGHVSVMHDQLGQRLAVLRERGPLLDALSQERDGLVARLLG